MRWHDGSTCDYSLQRPGYCTARNLEIEVLSHWGNSFWVTYIYIYIFGFNQQPPKNPRITNQSLGPQILSDQLCPRKRGMFCTKTPQQREPNLFWPRKCHHYRVWSPTKCGVFGGKGHEVVSAAVGLETQLSCFQAQWVPLLLRRACGFQNDPRFQAKLKRCFREVTLNELEKLKKGVPLSSFVETSWAAADF